MTQANPQTKHPGQGKQAAMAVGVVCWAALRSADAQIQITRAGMQPSSVRVPFVRRT